jgi:hypothetical protein
LAAKRLDSDFNHHLSTDAIKANGYGPSKVFTMRPAIHSQFGLAIRTEYMKKRAKSFLPEDKTMK